MSIRNGRPRVFVPTSRQRFDVSAAGEHGDVVYIFDDERWPSLLDVQAVADSIGDILERHDFDPERDILALTGPVLLVAAALTVAVTWEGAARVLVFDAGNERYLERTLSAEMEGAA